MSQRTTEDPGEAFWNGYYDRLQHRKKSKPSFLQPWMLQAAAALVLLLTGFLLGRNYFQEPVPVAGTPEVTQATDIQQADFRARQFLEQSQVLLLGVAHLQPGDTSILSRNRDASRKLVQQASVLKEDLNNPQHRRMRRLVSELEIILLQIANLEEQNNFEEIEMVKSGVDRKGILLKINLEQMKISDRPEPSPTKEAQKTRL
jgi:hypothetical protein